MRCCCCDADIALARKVKLRPWRPTVPGPPESAAYHAYVQEMTFRWAFICLACYRTLDNEGGMAEVGGRLFNLAGASRGDKAAVVDEAKYQAFQRREAAKMGLDI
jgi:hypothetical protein